MVINLWLSIIGSSGSGKTNALFNLIGHQPDIDKTNLHAKDLYGTNYQLIINKHKGAGLKHHKDSKAFIEYSHDMYIYRNIHKYNPDMEEKFWLYMMWWYDCWYAWQ